MIRKCTDYKAIGEIFSKSINKRKLIVTRPFDFSTKTDHWDTTLGGISSLCIKFQCKNATINPECKGLKLQSNSLVTVITKFTDYKAIGTIFAKSINNRKLL